MSNVISLPLRSAAPPPAPPKQKVVPHLRLLVADLKRTTDIVVMDVVVDLEANPTAYKARITIPAKDRKTMEWWLDAFSIPDAEWEFTGGYEGHYRVLFPVKLGL